MVARMENSTLEYRNEGYRITRTGKIGAEVPCVTRVSDNHVIAVPTGGRSMEIENDPDPAIIAFCLMSICLSRVSPYSRTIEGDFAIIQTSGISSRFAIRSLLALGIGAAFFLTLGQTYYAPPWATLLIAGYGTFMIALISALILTSMFRKVSIYYAGNTRKD